jgi:hypothetical protein
VRYAGLKFSSDDPLNFFNGNLSMIPGGGRTAENGAQALTLGVNWHLNDRVRAMFNWTNYWYENELGTPFSCQTSSCSAATLRKSDDIPSVTAMQDAHYPEFTRSPLICHVSEPISASTCITLPSRAAGRHRCPTSASERLA